LFRILNITLKENVKRNQNALGRVIKCNMSYADDAAKNCKYLARETTSVNAQYFLLELVPMLMRKTYQVYIKHF